MDSYIVLVLLQSGSLGNVMGTLVTTLIDAVGLSMIFLVLFIGPIEKKKRASSKDIQLTEVSVHSTNEP